MRILVIEDEENISAYLKKSLEAEGFSVDVALDGNAGLEMALTGAYAAITLDIMLPGMNGYEVCRHAREAGIATPILMLTAKDGEYDEADAFDLGADDYLSKPFSLVVLVARLRSLIRRGAQASPLLTCVDGIELNPQARTATREGVAIELTAREFALLEYLMLNAGRPLTKAQILEQVWGPAHYGDENVVEVYVGYLRKKVDAPFGRKSIKTVRGVGYLIAEGEG